MCLLLCGKLPFDGETQDEIVKATIDGVFHIAPNIWDELSHDAHTLMKSLLNRNPKERITARCALRHPFIIKVAPTKK